MNPYHGIDDPLKRAQAMTHDKQRVTMLKCFRAEIEKLGLVLQPDERRKAMSRLIEEWIPAMEEIGIDFELIENMIRKIQSKDVNEIGTLANSTVRAYYSAREWSVLNEDEMETEKEAAVVPPGSRRNSVKRKGAALGRSFSESFLARPTYLRSRPDAKNGNGEEEYELSEDANKLGTNELNDEDDKDWMTVHVKNGS